MSKASIIAIDGPVAVGKSTVGSLLAKKLGYRFLDTGVMYRAITCLALEKGIPMKDEEGLGRLAASARFDYVPHRGEENGAILIEGRDLSREIRQPQVERGVSLVARVAEVRRALVAQQRETAQPGQIVMAGRDIGTVVLPHADLKLFLQASPEERARRRYLELRRDRRNTRQAEVLEDLKRRDKIDSERSISPLQPAPEACIINTNGIGLEEVVDRILKLVEKDKCRYS